MSAHLQPHSSSAKDYYSDVYQMLCLLKNILDVRKNLKSGPPSLIPLSNHGIGKWKWFCSKYGQTVWLLSLLLCFSIPVLVVCISRVWKNQQLHVQFVFFSFIHNVSFSIKIMCDNVLLAMFEASFSKKFRPYYLSISNIGTTSISFYLSSASSKMKWKEY
jgi:hypothetical protein